MQTPAFDIWQLMTARSNKLSVMQYFLFLLLGSVTSYCCR